MMKRQGQIFLTRIFLFYGQWWFLADLNQSQNMGLKTFLIQVDEWDLTKNNSSSKFDVQKCAKQFLI